MRCLVIEDDDIKYALVARTLNDIVPDGEVSRAASYQSGVEAVCANPYDVIILDMTLPVYDAQHSLVSHDVLTFGGVLILRETRRRRICARFIVLSQYDTFVRNEREVTFAELSDELIDQYRPLVLGCVRLDSSSIGWKNELHRLIIGGANESLDCR